MDDWSELFHDGMAGLMFSRNGSMGISVEMYIAGGYDESDCTSNVDLPPAMARSLRDWLIANVKD